MNKIGKLTTFYRLLLEESAIIIPKVQRDYAYGRDENKVKMVLDDMLNSMFNAINGEPEIFDFVYGGSFIQKDDESSGLIPLDGQQRLTTMFLLFYYASIVQPNVPSSDVEILSKFSYETRQTATEFCKNLIGPIRDIVIPKYTDTVTIKNLIIDTPQYLPNYDLDPTIVSMLNVLTAIETHYRKQPIENLWTKLTTENNILFYTLLLEQFGLTDDLYIKMNSRGKKLTQFEIFKSDLGKAVKNISIEFKDKLIKLIDNEWLDVLWSYATQEHFAQDTIVTKTDTGFLNLFNNIFRLVLFLHKMEQKSNRLASIEEMTNKTEIIEEWMGFFNTIVDIHNNGGGLNEYWYKFFYFSGNEIGEDDYIRLFWQQTQNQKSIFHLSMERELSAPEIVYFYALIKLRQEQKDDFTTKRCLRIVRNLVTANTRAHSARYDMLSGFLEDVQEIITNNGRLKEGNKHTFTSTAYNEEILKTRYSDDYYQKLLHFENHAILQGSLRLFIKKYDNDGSNPESLIKRLQHFESLFTDNSKEQFDLLRINMLNPDIDYTQYESSMYSTTENRRYLIHNYNDWSSFFIENENRKNQNAILEIIDGIDTLLGKETIAKKFSYKQWQYYMAKYSGANRPDTSYGLYAWDNLAELPLEAIILNSSYHSPNNVEWKMLNHILINELWDDNNNYSLDYHASRPFEMNKYGITLSITQDGWLLFIKDKNLLSNLRNNNLYSISELSDDQYLIDFQLKNNQMDYIELAKQLIKDIEDYYNQTIS